MNRNLKLGEIENLSKIKLARFSETGTRFFTYVDDLNQIYINKIENSKNFLDFKLFNPFQKYFVQSQNEISSIIFSSSENEIINGSSKGIITFVDISTQKTQSSIKGHLSSITSLAIFPNQEYIVLSGAMDSQVKLWDSRSKTAGFTLRAHTLSISALVVSPDGKLLASGSNDGSVKIWDIHQQKLLSTFNESDSSITCLQFNPLDKAIATASDDGCISYWDLDKYNQISSTKPDKQTVYSIRFCNEGKSLIQWFMEIDTFSSKLQIALILIQYVKISQIQLYQPKIFHLNVGIWKEMLYYQIILKVIVRGYWILIYLKTENYLVCLHKIKLVQVFLDQNCQIQILIVDTVLIDISNEYIVKEYKVVRLMINFNREIVQTFQSLRILKKSFQIM